MSRHPHPTPYLRILVLLSILNISAPLHLPRFTLPQLSSPDAAVQKIVAPALLSASLVLFPPPPSLLPSLLPPALASDGKAIGLCLLGEMKAHIDALAGGGARVDDVKSNIASLNRILTHTFFIP